MRREFSVLSLSFFVGIMLTPFAMLSFVVIILVASTITKKKERASCSVCRTRELFIEASCAQSEANETDEKGEKSAFATTGRYAIQMNVLRMLKRRIEMENLRLSFCVTVVVSCLVAPYVRMCALYPQTNG